jgi:hypothetical protein
MSPTWNSAPSCRGCHGHRQPIGLGGADERAHRAEVDEGAVEPHDATKGDQVVLEAV